MASTSKLRRILEALGDLESAFKSLSRANRKVEAKVIDSVGEAIVAEISPQELDSESELILDEVTAASKPMSSSQKQQLRRYLKTHKPKAKQWLCCSRPKRMMTHGKTHKPLWFSTCKYKLLAGKLRGQTMAVKLVVGRDKAPKSIVRNGKRVRWC